MRDYEILNNSIIFSTNQDKTEILKHLDKESLFLNLKFYNYHENFIIFNHNYYFYLYENYQIKIDLANKIKKYFIYLDETKNYNTDKLNLLKSIKKDLLNNNIITQMNLSIFENKTIYSINSMPIPSFLNISNIKSINLNKVSSNPIALYKTEDSIEAAYCAYDKVVKLLEKGVSIDKINILNTNSDDDFNLEKIFNDAKIPFQINKPIKMNTIPDVIDLLHVIKNVGYSASTLYLEALVEENPNKDYLDKIISIYNNYLDESLEKYPEILYDLINNQSISQKQYASCININSIDDFVHDEDTHYIVMNYIDGSIPKQINELHYLNEDELQEIKYLSSEDLLKYNNLHYKNLMNSIDNLYLIFNQFSEEENHISTLSLDREFIEFDYQYQVKDSTYLDSLNQLAFAKSKYDLDTFYIKNQNYYSLYQDYHSYIKEYNHSFSGINLEDLKSLLKQNNTITPYKLESYNLCKFQFLLQNLLKVDNFESNINTYIGNLSHKVLEEYSNNPNIDYEKIIDNFEEFPEDIIYKERIYKKAIKNEMKELLEVIKDFHQNTKFNDIKTEFKFKLPLKDEDFYISGIIDKVMVHKSENGISYFVLIDYKMSDKDFSLEKYQKHIQLQLPMYLYAYKNSESSNIQPLGFFYQTTSLGRYNQEDEAILKNYRLKGVILEDSDLADKLSKECLLLEGITPKKDGGLRKSNRLFTKSDFDKMYLEIEETILDMVKNLKQGDFSINPIPAYGSKKDSPSCEYCNFKSICYNKNKQAEVKL